MKARLLYPVFACFVLALAGTAPSYASAAPANVYKLGPNEIVVTASPDKPVAMIGEAVTFSLKLENRGPGPVTINPGFSNNPNRGSYTSNDLLQVTSIDGKLVGSPIRPEGLGGRGGMFPQSIIVGAGESYSRPFTMSDWAAVTEPGIYQVRVRWAPSWGGAPRPGGLVPIGGTPIVFDASTDIRVEPANQARIGAGVAANIAQLGEAAIAARGGGGFQEAMAKLNEIDDPRVIPYLRRLVLENGPGLSGPPSQAFAALAKFPTDEALALLASGWNFQPSDLQRRAGYAPMLTENARSGAAAGLAASKHPGAFALLASHRDDPSSSVRRQIVDAAALQEPAIALPVLRELADDPEASVGPPARQLIARMTQPDYQSPQTLASRPPILRQGTELIVRFDARPVDLAKFKDEKGLTALKFTRDGTGPLTYLTERDLPIVLGWPELTTVELGPIPLTDETMAILARAPKLDLPDIRVAGRFITRDGFLAMARIPGLTTLMLQFSAPQLSDQELAPFGALRRLKRLSLTTTSTDATLAIFRHNAGLEHLTLTNSRVTDAAMTTVAGFRDLQNLVLRGTSITERGLESMGAMPALTLFYFDKLNDPGMAALARSPNLESLDLGGSPLTDAALPSIERLKKLTSLGLSDTKVTALPAGLTALRTLYLSGAPINDAGMRHLGDYRNLRSLTLDGTAITDAGLARLAELTELAILRLNSTAITDASLEIIAKLPNLTNLTITNTKVTNAGLAKLSDSKKLTWLFYRSPGVTLTDPQIKALIPSLYR